MIKGLENPFPAFSCSCRLSMIIWRRFQSKQEPRSSSGVSLKISSFDLNVRICRATSLNRSGPDRSGLCSISWTWTASTLHNPGSDRESSNQTLPISDLGHVYDIALSLSEFGSFLAFTLYYGCEFKISSSWCTFCRMTAKHWKCHDRAGVCRP